MDSCAQTIGQLFRELRGSGYGSAQLSLVRDAYELDMQLTAGLFTGSGKPTIAHDVGTASLAHHHGGSCELVAAGLLHSAYMTSDWGHYRRWVSEAKRGAVRAAVGAAVEQIVHTFSLEPWDAESIAQLAQAPSGLDERRRAAVFLKLIDQLERLLDDGELLLFRDADRVKAKLRRIGPDMCTLAARAGHPGVAAALRRAIDHSLATELPEELRGRRPPGHVFPTVIPRSCRKRRLLGVVHALASWRGGLLGRWFELG